MLLKQINSEKIEEIRSLVYGIFNDFKPIKQRLYFFHMLHRGKLKKKICEEISQVSGTHYYHHRAKTSDEFKEVENIINQILKFKEKNNEKI